MDRPPKGLDQNLIKKETINFSFGFKSVEGENHPGRNEDSFIVDREYNLFGVFDGMGGHAAGDVASNSARDFFYNNIDGLIPRGVPVEQAQKLLLDLTTKANEALSVKSRSNSSHRDMGTTMSLVVMHKEERGTFAVIVNIGDSRVYKCDVGGGLEQLSTDDDILEKQSISSEQKKIISMHLAEAKRLEDLNLDEQELFSRRNQITQALPGAVHYFSPHAKTVNKGDKILLTSDGIHDNLTHSEIRKILSGSGSAEDLAKELVQRAIERSHDGTLRSKTDDMTAVVILCE
ncbi:MAG TPA: PP2C family serine/threonine-protein phosphatase [Candidatus Paceibacterota bacterium]